MRTLVQQFQTLHSQIMVQSTTGNKAKLTFQMIKLKHYHYVTHFFSSPRSQQLVWQFRPGRVEAHLWFQFRAAGLRGQAGRCPSGASQVSALFRLNAHWWLLWWCCGSHGGVVINIRPGLIPLVHKQRLELLWELSTKVCGPLRAAELRSHHTTSGFFWPAAGVSADEDSWAANKGTEQQNRETEPTVGTKTDRGRDMRAGARGRRETTGHCFKLTGQFCCAA